MDTLEGKAMKKGEKLNKTEGTPLRVSILNALIDESDFYWMMSKNPQPWDKRWKIDDPRYYRKFERAEEKLTNLLLARPVA